MTVFQMLKYVVRLNERRLREGLPLCCVIPLVVYHGPSGWDVARDLDELIDVPAALRRFLPQFSIELFDLSGYNDNELRGEAFLHASLLLLKYILRPELPGELTRIFSLLVAMEKHDRGLDCIRLLLNYVAQGTDRVDREMLRSALKSSLPNRGEELMPTLAEQWAREGREQGFAEGIEQGIEKGIEQGIEKGIEKGQLIGGIQTCCSILSEQVEQSSLSALPIEELRELAERFQSRVRDRLSNP